MAKKPRLASEYRSEYVDLVRSLCLYVATKLGDLLDELVIVGGLVPHLIVDQSALPLDVEAHVGTMDLDVGLHLALPTRLSRPTSSDSWRLCSRAAQLPQPRVDPPGLDKRPPVYAAMNDRIGTVHSCKAATGSSCGR